MEALIEACRDKTVDEIETELMASRHADALGDCRAVAEYLASLAQ